ncbi:uncharacterized protein LOC142553659 isoform X3 [Primulina tabacum]|uniref:uncharacterized protein LOC142553659 isoform X3 n=1 Tax=Primulina tabacum TaxID=48773 RepID=UPI003F59CCA2
MILRFGRLRRIFRVSPSPLTYSGYPFRLTAIGNNLSAFHSVEVKSGLHGRTELAGSYCRYSSVAETKHELLSAVDVLSFVQSSLHKPKAGSLHYWLNAVSDCKNVFKEDGILLVLVSDYVSDDFTSNPNTFKMFENVKSLHQRYPFLQVLAVQYGRSISFNDISTSLVQIIFKEYINFPILLSKYSLEGPCYIISKGFRNPLVYPAKNVDLEALDQAIQELNEQCIQGAIIHDTKSTWVKPVEVVKELDVCSLSQNLLWSFPGCISVDECGDRLFLSDVNHHRIIVFNGSGKLLDAIGSSPGFEDGVFESAKLLRPAASFYHAFEDSIYFVDSENHAIRRADLERRVVETVFPATTDGNKNKSFWKWILDKVWPGKLKSEALNSESFLFPWHMLKASDNDLFVFNQSFGTLWVVDLESSSIRETVKESSKILEICGQMMMDKSISARHVPSDWLEQQLAASCSFDGIPYAGLMSSTATFQDHIVFCDTVGQTVVKFNRGTGSAISFPFSNFGVLGLPYWFVPPLEQVYSDDGVPGLELDHVQEFNLLPGRVDIELYISVPQQTELVEQPREGCIWRLARGAAAEVSELENKALSTEKVGIAQQWYDELDNLCYSTSIEEESSTEEESKPVVQEGVARIGCTINSSPGTSEVIILAALYLRLKKSTISTIESCEDTVTKMVSIMDPSKRFKRDLLVKVLTASKRDLEELIFLRHLHVRLKIDSFDHPKADNLRDIIVSESSVKLQVTL